MRALAGEPVERALQDESRGVLIDHRGALGTRHVRRDELTLDRRSGEPFVPQRDWKIGQARQVAREGPRAP